ncbi:carbohydrate-binding family 9-like protein [Flavivirga spongiicola]|uniref:Carbohydrate-binding family 9-like protein n=1 Tax=Flavivirga spongiicola TaxID=421621 RepID=A0ABU7XNZ0_9FLAO|nr:carbohydrate-binding family 9-like protein [Flavivirga sp. MEBiC05379]MDO5977487.1 carbohydrate-binding family 9-like protein [Flavivirga sp. MEBiC05379]
MKFNFFLTFIYCFSIISCAQTKKEMIPQTYVAHKTTEIMTIDGEANEPAWEKAKWTHDFIDIEGDKTPKYITNVKMLWDENYYYILAKMKEPHIWADIELHDEIIFYNNDFEVFIDPDGDTHNYYELEINALNTAWDLFIGKPYRESNNPVLNDWNFTGLKSAVSIDGTLNNPNDTDKSWTLEIAIPFKDLRTAYNQDNVPRDQFWRVNFSRVNWQHDINNGIYSRKKGKDGKFLPEYNWVWSPMGVINMHEPEKWGYVYFSSNAADDETFIIPQDEKIKWKLYTLYRAQKAHYAKHGKYATSIDSLNASAIIIDGKKLELKLENHSMGYNMTVKSPFSNKILNLKEDGKFISK